LKIKEYAEIDKIRLGKDNIRMCAWVWFQRCKRILDYFKLTLDIDEINYFDEYLILRNLNLNSKKKYSSEY
jgi:hypothetical protein